MICSVHLETACTQTHLAPWIRLSYSMRQSVGIARPAAFLAHSVSIPPTGVPQASSTAMLLYVRSNMTGASRNCGAPATHSDGGGNPRRLTSEALDRASMPAAPS
ncbi:hypothetical protein [Streptomyces cupreus]|uniref:Uncharacterized protein n=1 Tax=Streptomyces cupreus TaxID=2759956 RepID=A0A7X1J7X1_9ACTN|nr:hypothetical protein [Streptomyces cupreus]MBC2905759.1 hypothetical protein [Streptomyces cupreus]